MPKMNLVAENRSDNNVRLQRLSAAMGFRLCPNFRAPDGLGSGLRWPKAGQDPLRSR
jgi:hypothetical protein